MKLINIEESENFTVDIEVENTHSYQLENGIVTHNTVSLLAGVTPGIHYPIAEYYIRNVRFQDGSLLLQQLKDANYPVEKDKYSPNTNVVSFPIKEEYFSRGITDVSMWEQMENVAQVQEHWADNQVSVTISFDKNEAKDVKQALELYETRIKGASFLPKTENIYEQAPYISITKDKFDKISEKITKIKFVGDTHEISESYCNTDACEVKDEKMKKLLEEIGKEQ